MEEDKSLPEP